MKNEFNINEYEGMVNHFMRKNGFVGKPQTEDIKQCAYTGLWKAWKDYDSSKGKFTTLAYRYMLTEVVGQFFYKNQWFSGLKGHDSYKNKDWFNYVMNSSSVPRLKETESATESIQDMVIDTNTDVEREVIDSLYLSDTVSKILNYPGLTPGQKKALACDYEGFTCVEAGKLLGISYQRYNKVLQRARKIIRENFKEVQACI